MMSVADDVVVNHDGNLAAAGCSADHVAFQVVAVSLKELLFVRVCVCMQWIASQGCLGNTCQQRPLSRKLCVSRVALRQSVQLTEQTS